MSDPTRWLEHLENLLSARVGDVFERSGIELASIEERPFTPEENAALPPNGGAFLRTNYHVKGATIVVAPQPCPLLALQRVWHESAHAISGHGGLGFSRDERLLESDALESRTQELAEMSRRRRTGTLLEHCSSGCLLAQPQPTSCSHPDLQEVLSGLSELGAGGQELRRVLIERARTTEGRAWFGRAAEGVTVSNLGTPLLPDRKPKTKRQPAGEALVDAEALAARVAATVRAALEAEGGASVRFQEQVRIVGPVGRTSLRLQGAGGEIAEALFMGEPSTDDERELVRRAFELQFRAQASGDGPAVAGDPWVRDVWLDPSQVAAQFDGELYIVPFEVLEDGGILFETDRSKWTAVELQQQYEPVEDGQ